MSDVPGADGIILHVEGLEEESPTISISTICPLCNTELNRRVWNVEEGPFSRESITAGAEEDVLIANAHLERHG